MEDKARRYVALIQDERGYPPPGQLDEAPPDGPKPPTLHTVVLVEDYERALGKNANYELVRVSRALLDDLREQETPPVAIIGIDKQDDGTFELKLQTVPR